MIRITNPRTLLAAAALFAISAGPAQAAPVIDFTADNSGFTWFGNSLGCTGGCTLGYSFNVSSSVTIDGLGVYDANSDGLNNAHEVALWNSAGVMLASATAGPGSSNSEASASGAGSFVFSSISALTLGAGDYVLGALYETGDTDHVVFGASGIFSNVAGVSYTGLRFINSGVLQTPVNGSTSNDRYFGPTMRVSTPEPGALLLLSIGLLGMAASRRALVK